MKLSNLWLFERWVLNDMTQNRSSNALVRTTLVPTVVNSGVRDNVIPTFATAMVNSRILPGETPNSVKSYVEKLINDTNVKLDLVAVKRNAHIFLLLFISTKNSDLTEIGVKKALQDGISERTGPPCD